MADLPAGSLAALSAECAEVREADPDEGDRVDDVPASLVAAPGSTEETAALLRAAAARDLVVVARGAGTKLGWGRPPRRVDLLVDTTRMHEVVEHAAGDLMVIVQAGASVRSLQEAVAPAGQRLALDETVPGSTVGGTIATATSGPRRVAAGTVRDLLIGITVVRADGAVAKAGGKVVKNVAGYDLGKLYTGSYGTLGLVTQAAFRLHPVPPASRWVEVAVADADAAARAVRAVVHSQVVPAAVEVDWPSDGGGTVAVLLEGTPEGVQARTDTVRELLGERSRLGADDTDGAPTWGSTYPWAANDGSSAGRAASDVRLKLTCALSGVGSLLTQARDAAAADDLPLPLRGSAGAGVLYGVLPGDGDPAAVSRVVERLRGVCADLGGSVVVLDAPAAVKAAVDVWGPVHGLDLMRRVKDQFDPGHRFAPGRFVGGI